MSWWGTLTGGAFGYMLGGPLGALLGAALGRLFDRGFDRARLFTPHARERIQTAFFTATFAVMGRVAKADGRVSEDEIAVARDVMAHMALNARQREAAIALFNQGKREDFDLDGALAQLRRECHGARNLLRVFLEIQLHGAYADGVLHDAEAALLGHICQVLGIPEAEYRRLETLVRAARAFGGAHGDRGGAAAAPGRDLLAEAYQVLGVSPEAGDAEVKRAYRRLMSQHHPDKLVARGLPEEMVKVATERTQEIQRAYETVRRARGDAAA